MHRPRLTCAHHLSTSHPLPTPAHAVVGGHAGITILPLLSQVAGGAKLSKEQIEALTNRIQFGGDEVVKAKDGAGAWRWWCLV
jgi:malate/lactate dehydrogenase